MNKIQEIQQTIDDIDKELSLIECVYNNKNLMEAYNITKEFDILWNMYNKLKILLEEKLKVKL